MGELGRRSFLKLFGGAAAAVALMELDPERALWIPGAKTIFLPPEKAVVEATPQDLEALMRALGSLRIGDSVMFPDPQIAMSFFSDSEYKNLVQVGRRMAIDTGPKQYSNGLVRTRVGDGRMSVTLD